VKLTKKNIAEKLVEDLYQWMNFNNFIYHKTSQVLVKKSEEHDHNIYIDLFSWDAGKSWNLNFQVHVRIHRIENILNRYRPHVSKAEAKKTSTIAKSMMNLCQEPPFLIYSIADVVKFNPEIEFRLEKFAMPYMSKFSNISFVEKSFDLDEVNWPTRDLFAKSEILMAISIVQKEKKKFLELVEEFEPLIGEHRNGFFVSRFHNMISGMEKDYFV
jgi:hypothetical protein